MVEWLSGLLQYSVLSPEWWGSVLQGSVGSFVALAGVLLLIRHELRREERNRKAERKKEAEKRTYESLLAFTSDCTHLMLEGNELPTPALDLGNALLKFSIRESPGRTALNQWITKNLSYISNCEGHEKEAGLVARGAALVTGVLTSWLTAECPTDFFDMDDLDRGWARICRHAGVDPVDLVETPRG